MREFDSPRTHQTFAHLRGRSKLIRMSTRLLTGGQLVRFQSGAPGGFREDVGRRSSRQNFNLEIAGSIPAVLAMRPVGPMDHDASLRNSKFRFESGAGYQSLRARLPAARMGHCLCLDGGSIPLAPAKGLFCVELAEGLEPPTL